MKFFWPSQNLPSHPFLTNTDSVDTSLLTTSNRKLGSAAISSYKHWRIFPAAFVMRKVRHLPVLRRAYPIAIGKGEGQHLQPIRNKEMWKTDSDWQESFGKRANGNYRPAGVNPSCIYKKRWIDKNLVWVAQGIQTSVTN